MIKRIILPQGDPRGKWTPTYKGPFVVKNIFSGGAMILTTMDGDDLPHPRQCRHSEKILRMIKDPLG